MKLKIPYWPVLFGPWISYALGFLFNVIAVVSNGGQMPVRWTGVCLADTIPMDDVVHVCMTHASHLKFLSDWILINGVGIASPGDFFIWAWGFSWMPALAIWIAFMIKNHQEYFVE
jgi:Family of unknown function (DUF5317)